MYMILSYFNMLASWTYCYDLLATGFPCANRRQTG